MEYLEADEADFNSSNDFGKDIIPNLLRNGERVYAYDFNGYWRDVGTISSLWQANMDLLGEKPRLNMNDKSSRIYSKNVARPPHFIDTCASVSNSIICEGCVVKGTVINSILSGGVYVEEGALICDSVVMEDVNVGKEATIYSSIVDSGATVCPGASCGILNASSSEITVVASGKRVNRIGEL